MATAINKQTQTFDELISSVMPQLSSEEHDALQRDIEHRGVQIPIITDQDGNVIDGRNRSAIAKKLKKNVKKTVIKFRNDDDRLRYAMSVNLKRRHLSSEQYRELAKKLKKLKWTQQDIADITGVPRQTISDWLNKTKDSEDATNAEIGKSCNFYDIRLKLPENADNIILERVKRGDTEEEIAADFKVSRQTINKRKKKLLDKESRNQVGNFKPNPKVDEIIRLGDFKEVLDDIEDGTVDLILTDPPYPEQYMEEWTRLGEFAKQKLKPHGLLVTYAAHIHIIEVLNRLNQHLDYYWILKVDHRGGTRMVMARNIQATWKPILVFQNGFKKLPYCPVDSVGDYGRDKEHHEWGQTLGASIELVKRFSEPGNLVVDPFAGGGTVLVAAYKTKRNTIGAEIDKATYDIARKRLNKTLSEPFLEIVKDDINNDGIAMQSQQIMHKDNDETIQNT